LETYPAIEAQAEREQAEILWADEVGVAADHHPRANASKTPVYSWPGS
jgi:hypothetical protein